MINEKHKLGALLQKISKQRSYDSYHNAIHTVAEKYGVIFVGMLTGAGYYQWRLGGDDWQKFADAPENEKPFLAQQYEDKKMKIKAELEGAFFKDDIFVVPDDGFIYYRTNANGNYEFAITAWGFKYPNRATGGELDYWIKKIPMQDVNIAFEWNGKKFPNLEFFFNNLPKKTENDGWFHLGGLVPVGTKYNVVTPEKKTEVLVVEQNKAEYVYDLTQYFNVEISATLDGNPLDNQACELFYNNKTENLSTDQNGNTTLRLPLMCDDKAQLKANQPFVRVLCREQSDEQTPAQKDETLLFKFDFLTPEPPKPPKVKTVNAEILLLKDGNPISGAKCLVTFNGESKNTISGEDGKAVASFSIKLDDSITMPKLTVKYGDKNDMQTPSPSEDEEILYFKFEEKTPEPEPEFVSFHVLDYGGYPMPDLDIVLTTKVKGEIPLKTDSDGLCQVPKEWFEDNEKINIKFTVSDEYQKTHDIHSGKKRKSK
ncbi:MAG: hypothetical protein K5685_12320 [Bacteroidales bacterium]|nr:hypothetical protein [Bacteroidales bacterium]